MLYNDTKIYLIFLKKKNKNVYLLEKMGNYKMINSKLIKLYNQLNSLEKIELRKWINSKIVNKNREVLLLFNFIDSRKAITPLSIKKERVFEFVYKTREYNDNKMRSLISLTFSILEDFLIYSELQSNELFKMHLLIKQYKNKNLDNFVVTNLKKAAWILEKDQNQNNELESTYYRFLFEKHKYEFESLNNRNQIINPIKVMNYLIEFCSIEILKYSNINYIHQDISIELNEIVLLKSIVTEIELGQISKKGQILVYFLIYKTISENSEAYFEELEKEIYLNEKKFSKSDLKNVYLMCINFCIKKYNLENKLDLASKAFSLYIKSIENGCLLENNELSRFSFTNIVSLGLKINKIEDVEQFIINYNKYISIEFRQNAFSFNMSKIHYLRKNYKESIKLLFTTEFKDILWNLNAKYLILKILYETEQYDLLFQHLNSYNVFLNRKKEIGYHQNYFKKIGKQFQLLLKYTFQGKKTRIINIDKILNNNNILDFDWFNSQFLKLLT